MEQKITKKFLTIFFSFFIITTILAIPVKAEKLEALEELEVLDETITCETEDTTKTSEEISLNIIEKDPVAGQNIESNKAVNIPARNVKLKTSQKNKLVIGKTFQIKYSLSPLKSDDYITYRNFNKKIVKVDENGLVTAIGYGTAKIQLETSSGKKRNIYFTVTDENGNIQTELIKGEATEISFINQFAIIKKGKTKQIEPIFYPLGIYDNITYKSNDTSIATVSHTGLVTAIKPGETFITVTTDDGISANFEVTVYNDFFKGIDVSKWQGTIDWKKVSQEDIDYVMIRSSYGYEDTDPKLKSNVTGCEKYNIDYGFYHYTYAKNVSEAKKEAKYFLKTIKKYEPNYPLVLDIEEPFYNKMNRKKVTDIVVT